MRIAARNSASACVEPMLTRIERTEVQSTVGAVRVEVLRFDVLRQRTVESLPLRGVELLGRNAGEQARRLKTYRTHRVAQQRRREADAGGGLGAAQRTQRIDANQRIGMSQPAAHDFLHVSGVERPSSANAVARAMFGAALSSISARR